MPDLDFAPLAFTNDNGDKIIFVDFTEAEYVIDFDIPSQTAWVKSSVAFFVDKSGLPAFDLGILPDKVALNGKPANVLLQPSPGNHTDYKVVMERVEPGTHRMYVEHGLHSIPEAPLLWIDGAVLCYFHMTDLDRKPNLGGRYLAYYLPSNLEYDHYAYTLKIRLSGTTEHTVISNGAVTEVGPNQFVVAFPPSFTASCPLVVVWPKSRIQPRYSTLKSVDGRDLPLHISANGYNEDAVYHLDAFELVAGLAISNLESNFGPFPYDKITIFAWGLGTEGMEYAGAAMAGLLSLRHELDHSYFARCMTPTSGDSGWIDEAIARWGDEWYSTSFSPPASGSSMGRKSPYNRITSQDAYTLGRDFLSYLDYRFTCIGGLRPVLKKYFHDMKFRSTTNAEFKATLENALGAPLDEEFEKYVFGEAHVAASGKPSDEEPNPYHFHDMAQVRALVFPPTDHSPAVAR